MRSFLFIYAFFLLSFHLEKNNSSFPKSNNIACADDSLLNKKGQWKQFETDDVFPDKSLPKNQFRKVYSRIDSIFLLFRETMPTVMGSEPQWYKSMRGNSYLDQGPVPYSFVSLYKHYYCNTNIMKVLLGDETGTWAYVFVNHYNWFANKVEEWDLRGDGRLINIYELPTIVGQWKGRYLYAPLIGAPNARAVVLGHNGKLPWRSITQKEFLLCLQRKWTRKKQQDLANLDSTEIQLRSKNIPANLSDEAIIKWKQDQENALNKFLQNKEKYRSKTIRFYDEELRIINDYLSSHTDEMLAKPAIMHPQSGAHGFKGMFGEEDKGGRRLVCFSAAYFNKELPRHAAQFMILYWKWSREDQAQYVRQQIESRFPLEKLKAMIDK